MNRGQYLDLYKLILSTENILEDDIKVAIGLINGGVDPNTKHNKMTLFHIIVKYGNINLLKKYYDKGGNIFLKNPLCTAIDRCNVEMVEFILSKGVNANTYYRSSSYKLIQYICTKDYRFQDSKKDQVNNSVELLHTLIYYGADTQEKFDDISLLDFAKDNSFCNKLFVDYLEKIMEGYGTGEVTTITKNSLCDCNDHVVELEEIINNEATLDESQTDNDTQITIPNDPNIQEIDFNSLWNLTNKVENICNNPFWAGTLQGYSEGTLKYIDDQLPINLKEVPEIIELKETFKKLGFNEFSRNFFEFDMINAIMYLNKFIITDVVGNPISAGKLYFNMMDKMVNNIDSYGN